MAEEQAGARKSFAAVAAAARTQEVEPTQLLELVAELAVLAMAAVLDKELARDWAPAVAEPPAVVEEQEVVRKSRAPAVVELAAGPVAAVRTPVVEPTRLLGLVAEPAVLAMVVALDKEPARDWAPAAAAEQAAARKLLALEAARVEAARIPEAEPTRLLVLAAELAVPAMAVDLVKAQGRG